MKTVRKKGISVEMKIRKIFAPIYSWKGDYARRQSYYKAMNRYKKIIQFSDFLDQAVKKGLALIRSLEKESEDYYLVRNLFFEIFEEIIDMKPDLPTRHTLREMVKNPHQITTLKNHSRTKRDNPLIKSNKKSWRG